MMILICVLLVVLFRSDFHLSPFPVASRRTHQGLDYGAFEDVISTMDATRKVNRLTVEARFGFPVSRESKYLASQPLQRFASLHANRLSWQTLSPFGCLLPEQTATGTMFANYLTSLLTSRV